MMPQTEQRTITIHILPNKEVKKETKTANEIWSVNRLLNEKYFS